MSLRFSSLLLLLAGVTVLSACQNTDPTSGGIKTAVNSLPVTTSGKVRFNQELSGLALRPVAERKWQGWAVVDEGDQLVSVSVELDTAGDSASLNWAESLRAYGKVAQGELDLEAITALPEGGFLAAGSHGISRKSRTYQASRCAVSHLSAAGVPSKRGNFNSWITQHPQLEPFWREDLQDNGVNLEGLAAWQERLWLGLRAPSLEGKAALIEGPLTDNPGNQATQLHWLNLGEGMGVRDLAAGAGELLILSGASAPSGSRTTQIWGWRVGQEPRLLATLVGAPAKPEALAVLSQSAQEYLLLVLSDGIANGRPQLYRVPR